MKTLLFELLGKIIDVAEKIDFLAFKFALKLKGTTKK